MNIEQKPMFKKAYKKLYPPQKKIVNEEIKKISADPGIGVQKKQDLQNVFVHKFKMSDCQYLLAYMFDPETLTLIFLGVHENYYRDLKRRLY